MYDNLFSPVQIGRLEIKNRVAMTAMGLNLAAAGGGVNDDAIAFYEARAKGGVGLIISGLCRVLDGAGVGEPNQLAARHTGDLQGLERLMDAVHKYGTRIFIQLHHPGREGQLMFGEQPVAASAIPHPLSGESPRPSPCLKSRRFRPPSSPGHGSPRWRAPMASSYTGPTAI